MRGTPAESTNSRTFSTRRSPPTGRPERDVVVGLLQGGGRRRRRCSPRRRRAWCARPDRRRSRPRGRWRCRRAGPRAARTDTPRNTASTESPLDLSERWYVPGALDDVAVNPSDAGRTFPLLATAASRRCWPDSLVQPCNAEAPKITPSINASRVARMVLPPVFGNRGMRRARRVPTGGPGGRAQQLGISGDRVRAYPAHRCAISRTVGHSPHDMTDAEGGYRDRDRVPSPRYAAKNSSTARPTASGWCRIIMWPAPGMTARRASWKAAKRCG